MRHETGDLQLCEVGSFDTAVVAALHAQSFGKAAWCEEAIAEILAMPGCFGLIAQCGEEPHGFLLARSAADECEILSLGVVPAQRRRGTARALIREACTQVAEGGARRVFLEVAEDNHAARALYAGEGFRSAGRRPAYYQRAQSTAVDAVLLVRALP